MAARHSSRAAAGAGRGVRAVVAAHSRGPPLLRLERPAGRRKSHLDLQVSVAPVIGARGRHVAAADLRRVVASTGSSSVDQDAAVAVAEAAEVAGGCAE